MNRLVWVAAALAAFLLALGAQQPIDVGTVSKGQLPTIAIPDLRGSGDAQKFMGAFNETLRSDVESSGRVKIAPKTTCPLTIPQQPSDFVTPPPAGDVPRGRKNEPPPPTTGGGRWMSDWSGPPVLANYLAFGYTAPQNGVLVLYGWLFDLSRGTPANAAALNKRYIGNLDEAGARKVAHEFAADIMALFGGQSLFGTHIYFDSNRTGHQEIWMMDFDGKNQRQITHYNSDSIQPSISADGSRISFTSYHRINPAIV